MKAINIIHRTLDIQIGDVIHENVAVHYHCKDWWKNENHPHSANELDQMLSAFSVNDQVLVLCDDNARPLYVDGFPSGPQSCSEMIVLLKDGDVWYWDLISNQGYHVDPYVAKPSEPEIIKKWYICVNMEVAEFYTRLTPVSEIDTYGCGWGCGLANFEDEECCDEPAGGDEENDSWGVCPCGGDWNVSHQKCLEEIECSGKGSFSEDRHLVGCGSTQSRTGVQDTNCPLGTDYGVSFGDLEEVIEVGPRDLSAGSETKSICIEEGSTCGPYVRNKRCCDAFNPDTEQCTGKYDPYSCGTECSGDQTCTGWALGPPGAVWRWTIYTHAGGYIEAGCLTYEREAKTANYSTEDAAIITKVAVGAKETQFGGSYSQYKSNSGSVTYTRAIVGYDTACQSCDQGILESDTYTKISYTYSEISYGVGGWWTVVDPNDRFAVLISELNLSASAQSIEGDVSGSITSTTSVLLRIVDDIETDFEVAEADKNYPLSSIPAGREDLLIKPSCYARELPLTVDLRAFHWYALYDWILVAFMLDGEFEAALIKKENDIWIKDQLLDFKTWVGINNLEDYTMFLH